MTTYDKIIALMAEKNIKVSLLEKTLNLPTASIVKWKDNKIKPSAEALTKLADYFNVSVDYLLGREDNKKRLIDMISPEFEKQTKASKLAKDIAELPPDKQQILFDTIYSLIENLKKI